MGFAGAVELLVLGGTAWLGHAPAARGLADGHAVTCLAQGRSGLPPVGVTWGRADRAGHRVFVSSGNVYADHGVGADESAPLLPALDAGVMTDLGVYGEAMVACERLVADALGPDRSLLARVIDRHGARAGPGGAAAAPNAPARAG